jgi:hypothetical protein
VILVITQFFRVINRSVSLGSLTAVFLWGDKRE